jgi:hypothetical protein
MDEKPSGLQSGLRFSGFFRVLIRIAGPLWVKKGPTGFKLDLNRITSGLRTGLKSAAQSGLSSHRHEERKERRDEDVREKR